MEVLTKTVFVGNLPWITSNEDLSKFMSRAGPLVFAEVQRYEDTHRSKGWGLAEYVSHDAALSAVALLDGQELNGRQVHLRLDRNVADNERDGAFRVYAGNLAWSVSEADLMNAFAAFNPVACNLVTNMYGRSRGFAIVKFSSEGEAVLAIDAMNTIVLKERPLEVRFDRGTQKADDLSETRTTVYVGKVPFSFTNDSDLSALFHHVGPIVSAKLQRAPNGRSKGWGLIKFQDAGDAKRAVETMNGVKVAGTSQILEVRFDRK